jgi:hypothetical protein
MATKTKTLEELHAMLAQHGPVSLSLDPARPGVIRAEVFGLCARGADLWLALAALWDLIDARTAAEAASMVAPDPVELPPAPVAG